MQATATNITVRLPIYQVVKGQRDCTVPLDITGYLDAAVAIQTPSGTLITINLDGSVTIQAPDGTVTAGVRIDLAISQRPYANAVGDTLLTWLIEFRPARTTFPVQGAYVLEAGIKMPDGRYAKSHKVTVKVERTIVTMLGEVS